MKNKVLEVEEIKTSDYASNEKKDFWKCIKKNELSVLIIILLIILNLIQFFHNVKSVVFLRKIFFNRYDEFQWGGVTAIVAIISLVTTALISIHRIRADLVSKSRINWLQDSKELMSKFLENVTYYPYLFIKYKNMQKGNTSVKDNNEIISIREKLDDLSQKIETDEYLLLLSLHDNKDNMQINNCIKTCVDWINSIQEAWQGAPMIRYVYKTTPVTNLLKVSRDYYNREWNKAKKGK